MQAASVRTDAYANVIASCMRVRWDIEGDVLRGRRFDLSKPFAVQSPGSAREPACGHWGHLA